jgi:hypothetical protein
MIGRCILALFLFYGLCVVPSSAAQQPPPPVVQGEVPQHILFYMFFQSVTSQPEGPKEHEQFATAKLKQVAREAHLQDNQIETLRHFAADCISKVSIVDEKANGLIASARDRHLNPNGPPPQALSDLKALQDEHDHIIKESIAGLRATLGDKAFSGLEAALKPRPGSAISVRLPDELAHPAAPDRRLERGDFEMPKRQSVYESRLPVKVMVTPVGDDGLTEKRQFRMDDPVIFKVTLLNTSDQIIKMDVEAVMRQCLFLGTKQGDEVKRAPLRFDFLPARGMQGEVQLLSNVPAVVGTARLNVHGTIFIPGQYTGILQRILSMPPPTSDADNQRNIQASIVALNSNTVSFEIVP